MLASATKIVAINTNTAPTVEGVNPRRRWVLEQWVNLFGGRMKYEEVRVFFKSYNQMELAKPLIIEYLKRVQAGKKVKGRKGIAKLYGVKDGYVRNLGRGIGLYK